MSVKSLSHLEQLIMEIVWACGDCSVRDVVRKINLKKKLAYTTVATILSRLYQKGLVLKETHDSRLYYFPKISKVDYGKSAARSFMRQFFSSFGDSAVASFAQSIERLPKDKKKRLLKLLANPDENK
ncbi:MAG: hypothetical protein UV73_C0004G0144 [Candidatus Gottesmanbacteria bacterium GW2011_GWA2_43_14]|uniref:CopY family transcriptional regulator n=1 Tax=Candidatus Gottesmanbacteria bacterium GW2011_GWA2_43_14 TaxID=1618443 RepID=A0A0G1DK97_9BACT|nr:MAG: hypothetical protein UV73_C0004G0144 [Candidatus Gottesmanbacteria bacterium GW2011_GWA2_43_14]